MKTLYIFLMILALYNLNLFAQHYIGQDKIDELKESTKSSDRVWGSKSTNYEVYLGVAEKTDGYVSGVMIGFDRLKYSRGETVTLTFKRTGANSRVEDEQIFISGGIGDLTGDGFEVERLKEGYYYFKIKQNEEKKIFIKLRDKNQSMDKIHFGIGRLAFAHESRVYVFTFPPAKNGKEKSPVKPEWRYYNQNNDQNNGTKDFYLHRQNPSNII